MADYTPEGFEGYRAKYVGPDKGLTRGDDLLMNGDVVPDPSQGLTGNPLFEPMSPRKGKGKALGQDKE